LDDLEEFCVGEFFVLLVDQGCVYCAGNHGWTHVVCHVSSASCQFDQSLFDDLCFVISILNHGGQLFELVCLGFQLGLDSWFVYI
jgi:hypothetical protein